MPYVKAVEVIFIPLRQKFGPKKL